jgi:hypothetical protein
MGRLKPFQAFGKHLGPGESSIRGGADWISMAVHALHQGTRPCVLSRQMMAFASQEAFGAMNRLLESHQTLSAALERLMCLAAGRRVRG